MTLLYLHYWCSVSDSTVAFTLTSKRTKSVHLTGWNVGSTSQELESYQVALEVKLLLGEAGTREGVGERQEESDDE